MAEDETFFVGQKAFIDKTGEVLTLTDEILGVDFPGGKVQTGEVDFKESLKREVREETGLEIEVGLPFITWMHVMKRGANKGKKIFLVGYKCKYLGGEVVISDEHTNFRWVNKENLAEGNEAEEYFKYLRTYFQGT